MSKNTFSLRKTVAHLAGFGIAGLLAMAAPAQATTLALTGEPHGYENVTVTNGTPPLTGTMGAGQLQFTRDDNGTVSDFLSYCVELFQATSDTPVTYGFVDGATYYGAEKADALGRLFSGFDLWNTDQVVTGPETAALQLAIWEIVNETLRNTGGQLDLNLATGNFTATSENPDTAPLAQSWLDALPGVTNVYTIGAMTNPEHQDLLVLEKSSSEVPEPASLALVLGALGAMGAATRRRKASQQAI